MARHSIPLALLPFLVLTLGCGSGISDDYEYAGPLYFETFQFAEAVLGQPGFTENSAGATTAFDLASGLEGNPAVMGGILYLADSGANRILGFEWPITSNYPAAVRVLGAPDFATNGGGLSATQVGYPISIAASSTRVATAEDTNNRVLVWSPIPSSNGAAAALVLGQPTMVANAANCSQSGMSSPSAVSFIGDKVVVSDRTNDRILIWNSFPAVDGEAADVVVGQSNFVTCAANDQDQNGVTDTPAAFTLATPSALASDGTRLIIADTGNNRVLIWHTVPTSNFETANYVLGQEDFSSTGLSGAFGGMSQPQGVATNGTVLAVSDTSNDRILIWNRIPSSSNVAPDVILGQSTLSGTIHNDDNQDGAVDANPTARTLSAPRGLHFSGDYLIVNDANNLRTLVFKGRRAR